MEKTTIIPTTDPARVDRAKAAHPAGSARRNRGRFALGAVALTLVVGGAVACGGSEDAGEGDANDVVTTPAPAPAPNDGSVVTVVADAPTDNGGGSSNGGSSSNGGGQSNGGGSSEPTPPSDPEPSGPAPTIDSFDTPENIDCHNGDFQEFTASWTTTGAERVTISIDGPGVYAEYAADGETSLPFNCSSPHSFLLTAHGADGQTATRQVILEPRNVQPEPDPEGPGDLTAP